VLQDPSSLIIRFHRHRSTLVLVVGAALLLFASAAFVRRIGAMKPLVGVEWAPSDAGPVAVSVDAASPAGMAGLRVGDVLRGVDGEPILSALEADDLAWERDPGSLVSIRVSRGGREETMELVAEWGPRTEPYFYLFVVGLTFGLSGALIGLRWPSVRGGTVYILFAGCMFGYLTLSPSGAADTFDRIVAAADVLAGVFVPPLLFHVGVALTKRTVRWRRAALGIAYSLAGLQLLAWVWLSPRAFRAVYRFADPRGTLQVIDRLGYLVFALAIVATMLVLFKSYSGTSSTMHRGQMRWLLWGLAIGLGPFLLLYAAPWVLDATSPARWAQFVAVLPMLFVPAAFTAAMARYRLHDVDLLLLRGLTEVAAVLATAALYAATTFVVRVGIAELVSMPGSLVRYLGILVSAVAYPQMRVVVRAGVERAFYRQRYSYRATLLDWARELNTETDLSPLLRRLRRRVRDTLGVVEAEVLVRAGAWRFEAIGSPRAPEFIELDQASLARLDQEACLPLMPQALADLPWARYLFPMKVKGALRAILAVSEREEGEEPLTTEDRTLLVTLAAHAGTAIEAARLVLEVRRRAEEIERLHAQQARIFESSAVGLLLLDHSGRILAWNRALEEIQGLSRERAVGRRLGDVFPLHVARRIENEVERIGETEESRIFRLNMINHNSERVVLNVSIAAADEGGSDEGGRYVLTLDDVTERVRLEEQVLQQERLASLGLLAAGVAHEINTPLTGISSYAQLMREELGEQDANSQVLRKIEMQTARASTIANSLLTLARPERTVFEETDLNETVREVIQLFAPQVRGRRIRLTEQLDPSLPPVLGHRGKLQQVLVNLLLNAGDAVADGGEIQVLSYAQQDQVVVEVLDDGAGITEEDLPRIFDPFFTTKGRGQGTGLGLSVTYGIVQEHGGRIEAENAADGLTRFRVYLPAATAARAAAT
jgi:PAS domain S-box-containing protein